MSISIVQLDLKTHDRESFDCSVHPHNQFLKVMAGQAARKSTARTYVLVEDYSPESIIGYVTIIMASVDTSAMPAKYSTVNAAPLIARLAVDDRYKGNGHGGKLLKHALSELIKVNESLAVPFVFVDTKDGAESFYEAYGFESVPDSADRYFLTMKDILAAAGL